jgi:hypothetical protein
MRNERLRIYPSNLCSDDRSLLERWALCFLAFFSQKDSDLCQTKDRENESRFGATPVPGKIGMAMAGKGLHAQPPPRPPHHEHFGQHGNNPGNQLYVGNVGFSDELSFLY